MKRKQKIWIAATAVFAICCLCSCYNQKNCKTLSKESDQQAQERITIRFAWWGSEDRAKRTVEAVRLFEEKNPGISVKTSSFEFESYGENMRIAASVENLPEVFQGYIGADNDYMDQGLVESLDSYVEKGLIRTEDISDELLQSGMMDGHLYGLSMGCNVKCLAIDADAYKNAGLTIPEIAYSSWDALARDLRVLKNVTKAYGADEYLFNKSFMLEYFVRQNGEDYFSEGSGNIAFSEAVYEKFYTMKKEWAEDGLVAPYGTERSDALVDSELVKGESAVRPCYSNQLLELSELSGKNLKLILLPDAQNGLGTDIRPGIHICMCSKASPEQKEAAAKLIDFLVNDIDANRILNAERGIPVSKKVRDALVEDFDESQKEILEIVSLAEKYSAPAGPAPTFDTFGFDQFLKVMEEDIMYGHADIAEAYRRLKEYQVTEDGSAILEE